MATLACIGENADEMNLCSYFQVVGPREQLGGAGELFRIVKSWMLMGAKYCNENHETDGGHGCITYLGIGDLLPNNQLAASSLGSS